MDLKKIRLNDDYIRLGLACLFVVIIYLFIVTPLGLNRKGYFFFQDLATRYASSLFYSSYKNPDITIIALDDTSLREGRLKWPWPRARFGDLISRISSHEPKVIAVDVAFIGNSNYGQEDDKLLEEAIRGSENVVLASYIGKDGLPVKPFEGIARQAKAVGFVNKIKDDNSIMRFARAVMLDEGKFDYSFEVKAAALYKDIPLSKLEVSRIELLLGRDKIRLNWDGTFAIKCTQKPGNFDIIPVSAVFEDDFNPALIKDRLVMIGLTAMSLHDVHFTSLGFMPGVMLSANVLENIINMNILEKPAAAYLFIFLLIISLFSAYSGFRYPLILSLVITAIAAVLVLFIAAFGFKANMDLDPFGMVMILYISYGLSRLYLYIKSYIEKSKMLNLLIIDQDSGLYNIYYLLLKLQRQLKIAKDKSELPALILLGILNDKGKPLGKVDTETKKEIIAGVASIIKEYAKSLNGLIARTSDFEFGIMVPRYERERLGKLADSIYQRMNTLKLLLPRGQKSFVISVAIGISCGRDLEEKSAELIVYAAQEALNRAMELTDMRISLFDPGKEKISSDEKEGAIYATEGRLVDFVIEDIKKRNKQLLEKIEKLNTHLSNLKDSYLTIVFSLVKALEEKDYYTAGHSERVTNYSMALADKLKISDSDKETLREAALLHDVGKIGIPDSILQKKGPLTEEERKVIQRHGIESVKILEPATFLKDTLPIILHHHERYDGNGYPHGLTGERIPLGSRIIAVGDAFDAMTSGRGYNNPRNTEEAISILKEEAGKQFDSDLVEKFIGIIKESSANQE